MLIQITAKEWFDKTYGNTYYSTRVLVDGELAFTIEMGSGYGEQYKQEAIKRLNQERGLDIKPPYSDYPWIIFTKHEKCLKREVLASGKK